MNFPPHHLYLKPQYMPMPIPWHMMKPDATSLFVELGFGRGEYLLTLSKAFPNALIVGFEVSMTSLLKSAYRLQREQRNNVKMLLFDGVLGLAEFFAPNSVDGVYMNFPVPWPKKKHAKRRVVREDFWHVLARVLKVGGYFELMTDVDWYAEEARENAEKTGVFSIKLEKNPSRRVQTKYEQKWLAEGRDIFLVRVVKDKDYADDYERLFIKGADYMPHALIKKPWKELLGDMKSLEGFNYRPAVDKGYGVREVFYRDREILLRSYTIDKGFFQSFYIWIRPEDKEGEDVFLMKLDPLSSPFRTKSLMSLMRHIKDTVGDKFVVRHNLG
ncbi:MAG: tRNA (guanosine(46)-N7)-methyltransferase TrmB [Dictyoglomi bacterium]|nr:tRNA (guanosine(46)-N7)-methyltransferase TrmB [Dictyoglomota bacterium]